MGFLYSSHHLKCSYLPYRHRVGQIILVGQNHQGNSSQSLVTEDALQSLLGLWHTSCVTAVHHEHHRIAIVQVVPAEPTVSTIPLLGPAVIRVERCLLTSSWVSCSSVLRCPTQLDMMTYRCPDFPHWSQRSVTWSPSDNVQSHENPWAFRRTISECSGRTLTSPVSSRASKVDFPAESRPTRITWTQVNQLVGVGSGAEETHLPEVHRDGQLGESMTSELNLKHTGYYSGPGRTSLTSRTGFNQPGSAPGPIWSGPGV